MCPLRFVLLGASAAVAVCGVVFVTHNKSKQGKYERQAQVGNRCLHPAMLKRVAAGQSMSLIDVSMLVFEVIHRADGQICSCTMSDHLSLQDDAVRWRTVVDMMTGRYLWQAYLDWRDDDVSGKVV